MSVLAAVPGRAGDKPEKPPPDAGLYEQLLALTGDAQEALAKLDQEREEEDRRHQAAVAKIEEKRKTIRAVVRALNPTEAGPRRPPRRATGDNPRRSSVSSRVMSRVLETVLAEKDKFTALGLHEAMNAPWSEPHTYQTLVHLRRTEIIRKAGKAEPISPGAPGRWQFAVMNREAGEQLLARLKEELDA